MVDNRKIKSKTKSKRPVAKKKQVKVAKNKRPADKKKPSIAKSKQVKTKKAKKKVVEERKSLKERLALWWLDKKAKRAQEKLSRSTIQVFKLAFSRWLKPNWKIMAGAILCNVIVGASTGFFPIFIKESLDILFNPQSNIPLFAISAAVFSLLAIRATSTYLGNFLNGYIGLRIVTAVQHDLFKHFLTSDYNVIGNQHSGQLVSSFMNEARQVDGLIGGQVVLLLRHAITLIGILGGMIYINWKLSSFVLVFLPFIFYFMFAYGKLAREYFKDTMMQTGNINEQILEISRGAKIIRAYGTEKREIKKAEVGITELLKNMARVQRVKSASGPSSELLIGFGMAALFFYVGYQGRAGNFTQGDLIGFITAMLLIYQPLKSLSGAQASLQISRVATERVIDRLDTKSTLFIPAKVSKLKIDPESKKMRILFKDVSFSYPGTNKKVLDGVNFNVMAGEMRALVGNSGSGKSTVFNLLERFYDIDKGSIKIDGQDIKNISIESLRRSISLVLQDVSLFDDTIAKNIAYAKSSATKKEVIAAAKLSYAHEFIVEMPEGYETKIGENGSRLSGGQRQRISFARAALRDSPILLLDEPTSSLDSKSEEILQKGLKELMKNRTTLIIAHRLSTIQNADKIFVVDKGTIVERGNHSELLKKNGVYSNLYRTQLLKNDDASV